MKKKIASSILALSMAFNMTFVNVYAEDGELVEITDVVIDNSSAIDSDDLSSDNDIATYGSSVKITGGTINFGSEIFTTDGLTKTSKVGQIKFVGKDVTKEGIVNFDTASTATFYFESNGELTLDDDTTYTVTLLDYDSYKISDYTIANYKPISNDADGNLTFTATKDGEQNNVEVEKVTISGCLTFENASSSDFEGTLPTLTFTADDQDDVEVVLEVKNTNGGYFTDVELVKDVEYTVVLSGIDTYELANYGSSQNYNYYTATDSNSNVELYATKVEDDTNITDIQVTGIVTFPDAEFDENSFVEIKNIVFTPTKGGETKSVKLEYKGATTATYDVTLLNNKEYQVTMTNVDGYTLSETFTTPNETGTKYFTATGKSVDEDLDDEDTDENEFSTDDEGNITVTTPSPETNETFGDNITSLTGTIDKLPDNVTATLKPISTSGNETNTSTSIQDTIKTEGSTVTSNNGNETTTTTVEYDAPLVMFDLSLSKNYDSATPLTFTIKFDPIELKTVDGDTTTFLRLFHFDNDGEADIVENAEFEYNDDKEAISVKFTTNEFSPFAIAQGYSTVKITQNNSDSSSSSSSSSSNSTVSAVGSDGTTYYITGNIPTVGFISQLRNVTVGEMVNLDKITVTGKTITGWFYDRDFTQKVENTSAFVITQDVMDNGVFPQFEVVVGTLGASIVTSSTASNSSNNAPIYTNVPYTSVTLGARLF